MIQNKEKWLYGGVLFILVIIMVLVIIRVNPKKERDLPPRAEQVLPSKVESSPFTEIEMGRSINQTEQNAAIEGAEKKVDEFADRLFNELVERDVSVAANKMEEDLELMKHLDSMKEPDRKLTKKWDLPEDVLGETSTDKLFLHFIRSPMTSFVILYSKDEIGVQRVLNASSTLHEFYVREDLAEGALQMYREYDLSPEAMSDESIIARYSGNKRMRENPAYMQALAPDNITKTKIASICMDIMKADKIMLTPQFFPKIKGYEREYLSVMLDRYEKVAELRKIYGEDKFGAALGCVPRFCLSLAENLDEEFYTKLKGIKPTSEAGKKQFIEEIKHYLKN